VGEWAITPSVQFENPTKQTPFVAQMPQPAFHLFYEITSIAWDTHRAQPELAGQLSPEADHVQFFPDALNPGGTARPKVDVLIKVRPQEAGVTVCARLYDVDDRDHDGPIDTDPAAQGTNSRDNFLAGGGIAPLQAFPYSVESDANGEVRLTVDVGSIQPGNNFRVAAHGFPYDVDNVKALNRDGSGRLYYDDDPPGAPLPNDLFDPGEGDVALDSTTRHREVVVTDELIVWRKLHVEVDSMGVPETEVFPDDGIPIDVNPGDVPAPDTDLLASAFEAAYILPVLGTPYDEDTVDFVYHATDPAVASRGIPESGAYWAAYVIAAYEFLTDMDGDPNWENFPFGYNFDDEPEHAFIYLETLRDGHNDGRFPGWGGGVYPQDRHERQAVVHEIGHQFELYVSPTPHPPAGYSIMSAAQHNPTVVLPPDSFAEDELLTIRTTASV
jgi:hypothetical protein